jgi:hypothetical protein
MTGPDHYRLAEELLTDREGLDEVIVGTAEVHATVALAAATAMASDFGNRAGADTWRQAGGQAASVLGWVNVSHSSPKSAMISGRPPRASTQAASVRSSVAPALACSIAETRPG